MHKVTRLMVLLSSLALMLAVGGSSAATTSGSKGAAAKAVTKIPVKKSIPIQKRTAQQIKESSSKNANHVLASAEELSGTIAFVGPADKEVTLIGANGVPYDFQLTSKTKVDVAGRMIGATQLATENHKEATVRFLPTTRGNLAERLEISAS
jgi:hypothetical protein